ncbi:unnamed protein product [Somion occarium]|uniref:Carbohydrate kinase PfkB domain-containing protein n=1 Tax=Somion occarium TaxID=3059160 RepID=A0ABP1CIY9_9APHY
MTSLRLYQLPRQCLRWAGYRTLSTYTLRDAVQRGAPIDVHPEVQDALAHGQPVVALETTIVTHGMPYPTNLTTARSVEKNVRANEAIPATIGLIQGRVKIGLRPAELERLADVETNTDVVKVSRRDIGATIALKKDGGTTCSATLIFAVLAGIKVFATGGLGGVHRGGENTMDVSADLHELSRCSVGLVSAGVKSILDIGRTLEYLETLGVPVVSYGETNDFPAFYTRKSGFKSPWQVSDPASAARILHSQQQLGMSNGTLFAVPIPEKYEAVGQKLQESVEVALAEAEQKGINRLGKEATPWLLKRVGELTEGKSLASNVALIENTARVGARIAKAYSQLAKDMGMSGPQTDNDMSRSEISTSALTLLQSTSEGADKASTHSPPNKPAGRLVVVGASAIDITSQANTDDPSVSLHSTVPGTVTTSLGGVARNMAEAAHRMLTSASSALEDATVLVSPIGRDAFGKMLVNETEQLGMRSDGFLHVNDGRTAVCNMVLDGSGGLTGGVADMDIVQSVSATQVLDIIRVHEPKIIAVDGNLGEDTVQAIVEHSTREDIQVFFEPTSVVKSTRVLPAVKASIDTLNGNRPPIAYISPNILELSSIYQAVRTNDLTAHDAWWRIIDDMAVGSEFRLDLEHLARRDACETNRDKGTLSFLVNDGVAQMAINLLPFFQHIIIKCGQLGVIVVFRAEKGSPWSQERTNIRSRQVVAHGKTGQSLVLKHYPARLLDVSSIVNVTGAGDSLVGSLLASLVQAPRSFQDSAELDRIVGIAQKAAIATLQSRLAVAPSLSTLFQLRM